MSESTAFYCVSSGEYFLGAVGLINSLRLQGHDEPIYLLDCGLSAEQRALIESEVTIVDAPDATPPYLLKTIAPLRHPHETMVLIDVDMIVTRNLGELLAEARSGKVIAFENPGDRFVAEWGELLDLGPIERRRYLCSAFVAFGRDPGAEVLALMEDRQKRADFERNCFNVNWLDEPLGERPFLYLDQDVLNAVLATRVAAERVIGLEPRLTANTPFVDLEIRDQQELRVAYSDGAEPYLLHHMFPGKPWLQPMPEGIYTTLLVRLLDQDDLAVRVPTEQLPARLHRSRRGQMVRRRENVTVRARLIAGYWTGRARAFIRDHKLPARG